MKWSASGQFLAFMASASHSIGLPALSATTPSSTVSVSRPAYWKFDIGLSGLSSFMASTHSPKWFLVLGRVGSGFLTSLNWSRGSSTCSAP